MVEFDRLVRHYEIVNEVGSSQDHSVE